MFLLSLPFQIALLVIDEIHLLGDDRGPVLEVIVSRTNFISSHTEHGVRVVGLSTALANARDLADWLGIQQVCGREQTHFLIVCWCARSVDGLLLLYFPVFFAMKCLGYFHERFE